jgi:hypothetical protein
VVDVLVYSRLLCLLYRLPASRDTCMSIYGVGSMAASDVQGGTNAAVAGRQRAAMPPTFPPETANISDFGVNLPGR